MVHLQNDNNTTEYRRRRDILYIVYHLQLLLYHLHSMSLRVRNTWVAIEIVTSDSANDDESSVLHHSHCQTCVEWRRVLYLVGRDAVRRV